MGSHISGKVVVITEADHGHGQAIAKHLSHEGARLVLAARDMTSLEDIVKELTWDGGVVLQVEATIAESEKMQRLIATAESTFGHVDVIVNSSGAVIRHVRLAPKAQQGTCIAANTIFEISNGAIAAIPSIRPPQADHTINVVPLCLPRSLAQGAVDDAIRSKTLLVSEFLQSGMMTESSRTTLIVPTHSTGESVAGPGTRTDAFWCVCTRQAEAVAKAVGFAISQPPGTHVQEMHFRQTNSAPQL